MKIFKRILNRWGWKWVLPMFYLFFVAVSYILLRLCQLTIPANQRQWDLLTRSPGCMGLEVPIAVMLSSLLFPGTLLIAPFLRVVIGTKGSFGHSLLASGLIVSVFFMFLVGYGVDYLRNRNKATGIGKRKKFLPS